MVAQEVPTEPFASTQSCRPRARAPAKGADLMRAADLKGMSRRKRPSTTVRRAEARPAPDLVDRDFTASGPGALWVPDITYLPT